MGTLIESNLFMGIYPDLDRSTQWHMGYRLRVLSASVRQLCLVFELLRYIEVDYTPACIHGDKIWSHPGFTCL